ncbi:MAG TPA: L-histidine N(alpha)-methyltransferase [Oscillatoriales cyanobacterium M59_W2019_021]|nr:L-histidine N(alpha)-methyltransferase [Oscillatoriales cyanobacterium M4454_W2019_049]HIK51499.1 L-histidine N(alpha)-methyltransferase [Oscillatoriales cyanobacterium M59_W2019_021]
MQVSKLSPANVAPQTACRVGERLQLEFLRSPDRPSPQTEGRDVVEGLCQTPKSVPPRYFYDDRGSQLFEEICHLPEYYPTRTETAILRNCAGEIARLTGPCELVELGSGSSTKTRLLLDAYSQWGQSARYVPIDVSGGILESSARSLLAEYPHLQVCGLVGTYEAALSHLQPTTMPTRTIAFLGSTLGNLTPEECDRFFAQVSEVLQPGEYFLLGIDLQKPIEILEAAYNDASGVTAEFNLNMLRHLNHRFQGNFDLDGFEHRAFYNEDSHQIEMHLCSRRSQSVCLSDLDLSINFAPGETMLTEISRKFDLAQMQEYLKKRELLTVGVWCDRNDWFGVLLCQRH